MLNSLDLVAPSYRDAILASPGLASYWRMGEQLPTITIATLVNGAAAVPDVSPAVNEVQTITIANATAGTFTLTFGANTTSALAYNVTAALMQTALTGLASIGANNATVTLDGKVYTVTFVGALAGTNVAALTYTSTLTVPGILDSKGAITGTLNGTIARHAASVVANDFEGSADFDGSTGYVDFGDNYDFAGTLPFSVMMWINADTFTASHRLIDKNAGGANGSWQIITTASTGQLQFVRVNVAGSDATFSPLQITGAAHQVTAIYDGTFMTLYGDAQLGTAPVVSTRSLAGNTTTLKISRSATASSNFFDGRIDEIAIWTRALARSEVEELYWIGKG